MKVGKLSVLCLRAHSKTYKEILNDNIYCLKVIKSWDSLGLDTIIKSYKNYDNLINKTGIVKIYNVWQYKEFIFIRMEYLEDYITFKEWIRLDKPIGTPLINIIKILNNLMIEGYIHPDCGDGNFMIKSENDIKLIDIDLLCNYDIKALNFLGKIYRSNFHRLEHYRKNNEK